MKVKTILFNWFQCGSTIEREGSGEDYSFFEVGKEGVSEIIENGPKSELGVLNYLVKMDDGSASRIFNPNHVEYLQE